MRFYGSTYLRAVLLLVASGLTLVVLSMELSAAPRWAECADAMTHSLVLCDAGPGAWVVPATAVLAVAFAFTAGISFAQARGAWTSRDVQRR